MENKNVETIKESDLRDFALDEAGDLAISKRDFSFIGGNDRLRQELQIVLQTFKGEWFLERTPAYHT